MSQVEIVRRVYEAGAAHDVEGQLDLADAFCVITQDPSLPWGGRHVVIRASPRACRPCSARSTPR